MDTYYLSKVLHTEIIGKNVHATPHPFYPKILFLASQPDKKWSCTQQKWKSNLNLSETIPPILDSLTASVSLRTNELCWFAHRIQPYKLC